MRGIKDGETGRREQDIVMRYKYKVRELSKDKSEDMEAMSFNKLKAKLDHKKEYAVEYRNKHGNFISTVVSGTEPK